MQLHEGDCLEVLKGMRENSIDSIVTDPPAGISFMNKSWDDDKGGRDRWIAWMTEVMSECLRVLKPGGHALVWAIPRTSHWTATAVEDAGFEVRDVVTHLFGSGFPKSLDISKAIDKEAGAKREVVGKGQWASEGRKHSYGDGEIYGTSKEDRSITAPATDVAKQWSGWGTALKPAAEFWILARKKNDAIEVSCEEIVLSVEKNMQHTKLGSRRVQDLLAPMLVGLAKDQSEKIIQVGEAVDGLDTTAMSLLETLVTGGIDLNTVSSWKNISGEDLEKVKMFTTLMKSRQITESKISNCTQFQRTQGFTNPNSEHYVLARKPLSEKTVAKNVLKHGTGGLNIDASRIGTEIRSNAPAGTYLHSKNINDGRSQEIIKHYNEKQKSIAPTEAIGRFPANLALSGDAPELLDEQSGSLAPRGKYKKNKIIEGEFGTFNGAHNNRDNDLSYGDSGGASRFFYCAKVSPSERNAGLEDMESKPSPKFDGGDFHGASTNAKERLSKNTHPTVKPLKLMTYLIKLITPPGGIVLDPFMGSGSTGLAAKQAGFNFVGIEKEKEYFEIAHKRINKKEIGQMSMEVQ